MKSFLKYSLTWWNIENRDVLEAKEWHIGLGIGTSCTHCLGMNYYVNLLGGIGSNGFHIK